jgi:hypothetical protein
MIQKQAMDPGMYVPVLAALAGGIFGYNSGGEDDDTPTKLLRALGYGAVAGVGASLLGPSLFGRKPKVWGVWPTDDESTAKTLGTLIGTGLGFALPSAASALYQLRHRSDYEAAQREVQRAEADLDAHRQQLAAMLRRKNIPQQNIDALRLGMLTAAEQLANARARMERTRISSPAMNLMRYVALPAGAVIGAFLSG